MLLLMLLFTMLAWPQSRQPIFMTRIPLDFAEFQDQNRLYYYSFFLRDARALCFGSYCLAYCQGIVGKLSGQYCLLLTDYYQLDSSFWQLALGLSYSFCSSASTTSWTDFLLLLKVSRKWLLCQFQRYPKSLNSWLSATLMFFSTLRQFAPEADELELEDATQLSSSSPIMELLTTLSLHPKAALLACYSELSKLSAKAGSFSIVFLLIMLFLRQFRVPSSQNSSLNISIKKVFLVFCSIECTLHQVLISQRLSLHSNPSIAKASQSVVQTV